MNTYKKRILAADLFKRKNAKTLYHALIYGSGHKKIGSIVADDLEKVKLDFTNLERVLEEIEGGRK